MQRGGQNTRLLGGLDNNRAGTVTKQHTGGAIVPVQNPGENLGANDQRLFVAATADEFFGNRKSIRKAGANRLNVECGRPGIAEFRLQQAGRTRKDEIRCRCRNNDQIEFISGDICRSKRTPAGLKRQITGSAFRRREMSRLDACAGNDPFVIDVGASRTKVEIAYRLPWQITANARDTSKHIMQSPEPGVAVRPARQYAPIRRFAPYRQRAQAHCKTRKRPPSRGS